MILGLMAGELLRSARNPWAKFRLLFAAGALCLAVGVLLDLRGLVNLDVTAGLGVCPTVKRIWTPSWAIFSAGWTFWILAGFYLIIDIFGYRRWAFPLIIVGMNSIAMYCMYQLWNGWISRTLHTHLNWIYQWWIEKAPPDWIWASDSAPHLFDGTYGPIVKSVTVLSILWLICLWLYRRGIFLRI
jgi:predicted acyltransferase